MKKSILILGAALSFAVAGCEQNQGGAGDETGTSSGRSSISNVPSSSSSSSLSNAPSSSSSSPSDSGPGAGSSSAADTNPPPPQASPPNP